jgi:hypothetical protein
MGSPFVRVGDEVGVSDNTVRDIFTTHVDFWKP